MASISGYFSDLQPPPIPNLPGYNSLGGTYGRVRDISWFNYIKPPGWAFDRLSENMQENQRPRKNSLTYKHGVPLVTDQGVHEPLDPLRLDRHNWLGSHDAHAQKQLQPSEQPAAAWNRPDRPGGGILMDAMSVLNNNHNPFIPPPALAAAAPSSMQWTGHKTPGWLRYDNKVLRFYAFFTEAVEQSPVENNRIRRCQIRYFMEDDTLEIIEPQEPNSGLPQGRFLNKHKVRLADGGYLSWRQLRVGTDVTIYSRTFHVVGCDKATREYLTGQCGIHLNADTPIPEGDYGQQQRLKLANSTKRADPQDGPEKVREDNPLMCLSEARSSKAVFQTMFDDRRKHDALEGKVLRFYCCWDDANHPSGLEGKGQRLPFELHYYISDDTIEVVEVRRDNTGRDPFPLLLSRRLLPQDPNVPPVGGRPLSPRSRNLMNIKYYNWRNLRIGSTVSVYGRDMLIYDCDNFTKSWYKDFLGFPDSAFVPLEVDFDMRTKRPNLPIPNNLMGIGSEEDSMQSVLTLMPKRKPSNYQNYMENWNKILRFKSHMVPIKGQRLISPHDESRRFVVSFHVLDNTISIFEPKVPNAGIRGGTYLERTKVFKSSDNDSTDLFAPKDVLTFNDMYVGAVLNVFSRGFELVEADEHTLKHMEENPNEYPHANYERVLVKVQAQLRSKPGSLDQIRDMLLMLDGSHEGTGHVSASAIQDAFSNMNIDMRLHEAVTMVRTLGNPDFDVVSIIRLVQALAGPDILEPTAPQMVSIPDVSFRGWQDQQQKLIMEPEGQFLQQPHEAVYLSDQPGVSSVDDERYRMDNGSGPSLEQKPSKNFQGQGPQPHLPVEVVPDRTVYKPDSTMRSNASRVAGPFVGAPQPGSLWQTTNKAIGGIHR